MQWPVAGMPPTRKVLERPAERTFERETVLAQVRGLDPGLFARDELELFGSRSATIAGPLEARVTEGSAAHRFYGELAAWWPLISPAEEYSEEAAFLADVLGRASIPVRAVLELGSGGGHNAVHLAERFAMTLVDLSPEMLEVSLELNPDCEHRPGDMRTVRLGRAFDAVLLHDAVDYMTNETDLRRAVETAFEHCRPGGLAVFVPDHTAETFVESTDRGGSDGNDGRAARYLEWSWDPDPSDTWILTEYAFLLRDADDSVQVFNETHRTGVFSRDVWLRLLTDAGFTPEPIIEQTSEERTPREVFVGHRPSARANR